MSTYYTSHISNDKITRNKKRLSFHNFISLNDSHSFNCDSILLSIKFRFTQSFQRNSMNQVLMILLVSQLHISSQILDLDDDNRTIGLPYCFKFTWLGPKYNDESQFKNATCSDIVNDKSVPCRHPLVVTSWVVDLSNSIKLNLGLKTISSLRRADNSNIPDTKYIWNEYRSKPTQIGCRLVKG